MPMSEENVKVFRKREEVTASKRQESVCSVLNSVLETAQTGVVQECMVIATLSDNSIELNYTGCKDLMAMLGMIEYAKSVIMRRMHA